MKGAEILVKSLESQGVEVVFGIPGNHNLALYDELSKSKIKRILATHEPSAGFMADAYGRVSGEPGVAIVTAGPGILNMVNPVAQAYVESSPMVIIASQCNSKCYGKGHYHELDNIDAQINIFKNITKWQARAESAAEIPKKISEAFWQAKSGRKRPVYLEIPENIHSEDATGHPNFTKISITQKVPAKKEIESSLAMIASSKSPVIIAGGGVICSNASPELISFAENLNLPVATTVMGKSSIPSNHPLALGCGIGRLGAPAASEIISKSDLMVAVGCRFDEVATGFFTLKVPEKLIIIDIDEREALKRVSPNLCLNGDAKATLEALALEAKKIGIIPKNSSIRDDIALLRESGRAEMEKRIPLGYPNMPELLNAIDKLFPKDSILLCDTGNSLLWVSDFPLNSKQLVAPAGYNSMGFSLPGAIAAKLAKPEKTIAAICGDGSFLMTGMELITAVRYNLDLNVFVIHDGLYNILSIFQDMAFGGRRTDTEISTFDFAKFADLVGAKGIRIEKNCDLNSAIKKGLSHKGPVLFDVIVDPALKPFCLGRLNL
jgi:acetolactate synthase-1/2/3 large subunit